MRQISMEKNEPALISKIELIQKEIDEIKNRELEFRSTHSQQIAILARRDPVTKDLGYDFSSSSNSDDSGIGTSPTPSNAEKLHTNNNDDVRNLVPKPQPRTSITKSLLKPSASAHSLNNIQGNNASHRQFIQNQKGIMQRFIASRGKIAVKKTTFSNSLSQDMSALSIQFEPASNPQRIERDHKGRPIRRGYIPVEEKIQQELQDLKLREVELKRVRKEMFRDNIVCQYNSDSEDMDPYDPPAGKLKPSKSIGELYDALKMSDDVNISSSLTSIEFSEKCERKPAISLAQLCDLDPKEAPSSHKLIEKWESLIQSKKHQKMP